MLLTAVLFLLLLIALVPLLTQPQTLLEQQWPMPAAPAAPSTWSRAEEDA